MKKGIIMFMVLVLFAGMVYAENTKETLTPISQDRTIQAFTVYTVGGSTTTAATYAVFTSSIEFVSADGAFPGTTNFMLANFTLDSLLTHLNAVGDTVPGAEGGLVATRVQGSYGGSTVNILASSETHVNCFELANAQTVNFASVMGISYVFPASGLASEQQYHLTDGSINVTFASTSTVYVAIYDGTTTTTRLRKERIVVSAVDAKLDITEKGFFAGSENTAMRVDVYADGYITAGWINLSGFKQ